MFGLIKKYFGQRRINKLIEETAEPKEAKAILLINEYSQWTTNGIKGANCPFLPPSTPRPSSLKSGKLEYAVDFLVMKNFLEMYPDYKTYQAKRIRKYYGL